MNGKRKATILVCPPVSKPCEPEPSVLALAGRLSAEGHDCRVIDANLTFHEALLSPDSLGGAALALGGSAATSAKRAANRAGTLLKALAGQASYRDAARYASALGNLSSAYKGLSRSFGAQVSVSDFTHPTLSPLNSAHLAAAAGNPSLLPTRGALEACAREILEADPGVVGVSVTYLSQALHAWALAGLLREGGFAGPLVVGGALLTSWAGSLSPESPALAIWDAAVVGPGERFLAELAGTGKIPASPGVLAPGAGIWKVRPESGRGVNSFTVKAEGLRWGDYAAPGGILPVAASRGCYWAKCAFCPEAGIPYEAARIPALAKSLLAAREAGGPKAAHFTDNALSPAHLKKLAAELAGEAYPWYGFARVERQLAEPGFMEALAQGGCRMLQFGIESASPRLLQSMAKGATVELADRVVRAAAGAGIRVFGYFLFGMPTETREEAQATLDWILGHADFLTCLNLSIMNLPSGGEIGQAPESFGLDGVAPLDAENDLSLYVGYGGPDTLERSEIRRLLSAAKKDAVFRKLVNRSPRGFTSNHAAFAPM